MSSTPILLCFRVRLRNVAAVARPWLSALASALVLAALVMVEPLAFAHEQKVALTDIFYNERTGNLEVAHRIRLHDAEHALRKATKMDADLAKSSEAQEAFARYVAGRFALSFRGGTPLKLTLLGQEIERGYLWVYQETSIPDPISKAFLVSNTILQDVVKDQVNTVNIRYGKQVSTFEFRENAVWRFYPGPGEQVGEAESAVDEEKGKSKSR